MYIYIYIYIYKCGEKTMQYTFKEKLLSHTLFWRRLHVTKTKKTHLNVAKKVCNRPVKRNYSLTPGRILLPCQHNKTNLYIRGNKTM